MGWKIQSFAGYEKEKAEAAAAAAAAVTTIEPLALDLRKGPLHQGGHIKGEEDVEPSAKHVAKKSFFSLLSQPFRWLSDSFSHRESKRDLDTDAILEKEDSVVTDIDRNSKKRVRIE